MKKYLNKLTMFIMTFVLAFSVMNLDARAIHAENATDAEDITVKAYVPEDWDAPALWAWSDAYGDAFDAWPGEEFEEEGDWYTIEAPAWIEYVIVNGNGGDVQTGDISVEAGKNLWIVVKGADDYEVYYEEVDLDELSEEPAEEEPTEEETEAEIEETEEEVEDTKEEVEDTKEEVEDTKEEVETTEAQEEEQKESSNTGLYVVLGIIALAIIILIIYFSRKDKK